MKALTLHQPWGSLIALGVKAIENRPRRIRHRGALAIHAGLTWDAQGAVAAAEILETSAVTLPQPDPDLSPLGLHDGPHALAHFMTSHRGLIDALGKPELWPMGVLLGVVDLIDVLEDAPSPWAMPGCRHWLLANPRPLPRALQGRAWRGMQGLWELPISFSPPPKGSP